MVTNDLGAETNNTDAARPAKAPAMKMAKPISRTRTGRPDRALVTTDWRILLSREIIRTVANFQSTRGLIELAL